MTQPRHGIAIVSTTQGEGHGAEIVLEELLHGWRREAPRLTVVAPAGSRVLHVAQRRGMAAVALDASEDAFVSNARAVLCARKALRGVDLVHAWSARSFEFGAWLARWLRVPACGTQHDHPHAVFHGRVRRHVMRIAAHRFRELICVSEAVAGACRAAGYRCPLTVIHNGLRELPVEHHPSPCLRVGFLGMYAVGKGFDIVAGWIRRNERLDVQWFLYGDMAPGLQSAASALAREKPQTVNLMGNRPRHEIFGNLDVLVHASRHFEAFGMVLIEAAQAGLPVVASEFGGASEIVVEGKTGFLFDPHQTRAGEIKLQRLLDSAELRSQLGRQARVHYERHFQVERMTARYQARWERAIACPNRTGHGLLCDAMK